MVALSMIPFLGTVRSTPSLTSLAPYKRQISIKSSSFSFPRKGLFPFRRFLQASLQSSSITGVISKNSPLEQSEIIFIGTGTSEGIPRVSCLTDPVKKCLVCTKAAEPGNKNQRLNTSLLVRYCNPSGRCNILIDAGKFFYHSALRWFPEFGIRTIDAVIITHSHADAIGGLDDLRDWTNNVQPTIPIYVARRDFEVMQMTRYYLVDTSVIIPGAAVSKLQFNIINEEPFIVRELQITPLPVWHGHGYRSLGFRFGYICYISDVNDIPDETYPLLENREILILVLPLSLPLSVYMDHEKVSEYLENLMETEGLYVQLSYDGLRIPVALYLYILVGRCFIDDNSVYTIFCS